MGGAYIYETSKTVATSECDKAMGVKEITIECVCCVYLRASQQVSRRNLMVVFCFVFVFFNQTKVRFNRAIYVVMYSFVEVVEFRS